MKTRLTAFFVVTLFFTACEDELSPPELWIDVSPVYVGIHYVNPDAQPYHFDLQLTNRGEQTLVFDSVQVRGDQNCAFLFEGPDEVTVPENESVFIRGWYEPVVPGDDQIALEIYSNSPDSPLIIPVCGRGVPLGTEDPGEPPTCEIPPDGQPGCEDG